MIVGQTSKLKELQVNFNHMQLEDKEMNKIFLVASLLLINQSSFSAHHGDKHNSDKVVIGYDTTEGVKKPLYGGSLDNIKIWEDYIAAHTNRDLNAIRAANAEDFMGWASNGQVIEGTDAHIAFLTEWFANSDPQWTHMYSIANNFIDKNGKLQEWVTTEWAVKDVVNDIEVNSQEVFDVLIEDGKIKYIYVTARPTNPGE